MSVWWSWQNFSSTYARKSRSDRWNIAMDMRSSVKTGQKTLPHAATATLRKHQRGRVGRSWYCDETYLVEGDDLAGGRIHYCTVAKCRWASLPSQQRKGPSQKTGTLWDNSYDSEYEEHSHTPDLSCYIFEGDSKGSPTPLTTAVVFTRVSVTIPFVSRPSTLGGGHASVGVLLLSHASPPLDFGFGLRVTRTFREYSLDSTTLSFAGAPFTFADPSLLKRKHLPSVRRPAAKLCVSMPVVFATLFQDSRGDPLWRRR